MKARIALVAVLGLLVLGGLGLWLTRKPARKAGPDPGCQASMRTLVGAIELFRAEEKRPPERLDQLVPRDLDRLPPCPAAKKETYSTTYLVYGQKYSFFCRGKHHQREDHPVFNSVKGWQ